MKILKAIYLLLAALLTIEASAQEVITGLLCTNRQLEATALQRTHLKGGTAEEPVAIPFQ